MNKVQRKKFPPDAEVYSAKPSFQSPELRKTSCNRHNAHFVLDGHFEQIKQRLEMKISLTRCFDGKKVFHSIYSSGLSRQGVAVAAEQFAAEISIKIADIERPVVPAQKNNMKLRKIPNRKGVAQTESPAKSYGRPYLLVFHTRYDTRKPRGLSYHGGIGIARSITKEYVTTARAGLAYRSSQKALGAWGQWGIGRHLYSNFIISTGFEGDVYTVGSSVGGFVAANALMGPNWSIVLAYSAGWQLPSASYQSLGISFSYRFKL